MDERKINQLTGVIGSSSTPIIIPENKNNMINMMAAAA